MPKTETWADRAGKCAGWRGKKCASPVLAPWPRTVSFEGQFTLKSVFLYRVWVCLVRPPSVEFHPHLGMHGPSKDCCLLFSEATREININLTSDHILRAPKKRYQAVRTQKKKKRISNQRLKREKKGRAMIRRGSEELQWYFTALLSGLLTILPDGLGNVLLCRLSQTVGGALALV